MVGGGKCCSFLKCGNCNRKLKKWKETVCEIHLNELHKDCSCGFPFYFFPFPKNEKRRQDWLVAINRPDFNPGKHAIVCSQHFVDGRPTEENPSPSINLICEKKVAKGRCRKKQVRPPPKKKRKGEPPILEENSSCQDANIIPDDPRIEPGSNDIIENSQRLNDHVYAKDKLICKSVGTQVFLPGLRYSAVPKEKVLFYTGLKKEVVDNLIFYFTQMKVGLNCQLHLADQVLLVLMRLRLGLLIEDLADRFSVSPSFVSNLFKVWIKSMSTTLRHSVRWLPRDVISENMPLKFKAEHPNTTCVIDCIEVYMQKAVEHQSRSYSNYKSHKTVKFLVAFAPHGYIMYISPCYGGKASDKHIALESGFLGMLSQGDEVMVDRGFRIETELSELGVSLNIPEFTRGKMQFSEEEVTATRRIASRIRIEGLIRRLRSYHILNTIVPTRSVPVMEDIVMTCAALVNLKPPLINIS